MGRAKRRRRNQDAELGIAVAEPHSAPESAPESGPESSAAPAEEVAAPSAWLPFRSWYLLLVPVLAFVVYGNSLGGEFVWDDRPLIVEDYSIKSLEYFGEIFTNDFFSRNESDLAYGYYRPTITLTYVLDYALWGAEALGFHVTNVLLHAAGSLLLVLALMRLGMGRWGAWFAGLLFVVHPIHTENVAWISGRTDVTAFLLTIATFLAYTYAIDAAGKGRSAKVWAGATGGLFLLALLAKEMAVVLLPWIFCLHLHRGDAVKRAVLRTLPLTGVFLLYLIWRFAVVQVPAPGQPEMHTPVAMVLSALPIVFRYLGWLLVPFDQSAYVQNPYVTGVFDVRFLLSVVGAAAVAVGLRRWFSTRRSLCLLVFALLSSFLPIINIVRIAAPIDMGAVMAERFAYFPSAPFLALVAAGVGLLGTRWAGSDRGRRTLLVGGAALLVAVPAGATVLRNRVWQNDLFLYEDMLERVSDSPLIWSNLTNYYIRIGDFDQAQATMERVTHFGKDSYFYSCSQAQLHMSRGEFEAAIPFQEGIVADAPKENVVARSNLAYLYQVSGRLEEASVLLEALLEDGKTYSSVHLNLAQTRQQQGRFEEAREQYALALESQPDSIPIGIAWAALEMGFEDYAQAEEIFRSLIRLHAEDPRLYHNLALVQQRREQNRDALASFHRAVELDPDYARARLGYATLLREEGDDAAARIQLEEVLRRAPGSPFAEEAEQALRGGD